MKQFCLLSTNELRREINARKYKPSTTNIYESPENKNEEDEKQKFLWIFKVYTNSFLFSWLTHIKKL